MAFSLVLVAVAAFLCFYLVVAGPGVASAQEAEPVPHRTIAELFVDDDGRNLYYPSAVFYDPVEEEIYAINGGSSRVIVYGPDFFPRMSIGAGRGVMAPRGVHVTASGKVYICQGRNKNNPVPRITILNGAFFVEREILLDAIPEAANFSPRKLAVSRDGLIYLVGDSSRGVLVLDRDGTFLRRLQPMDMIHDKEAVAEAARQREEAEQLKEAERVLAGGNDEQTETGGRSRGEIPEEFRPKGSRQDGESRSGPGLGPVRVGHLSIDSAGNLYLLSAETSKTYVYSPDETFLFSFGEKGGTPRKLSQPRSLAIDEKRGMIYVADFMRHTILVFDLAGKFLFEFGGRGPGHGWFNFPADLALNRHGQLIVADLFNQRVQVLEVDSGAFPMFKGDTAPAASQAVSEGAASEAPAAGSSGTPVGEAAAEAAPLTDAPGAPEEVVEEVLLPEQVTPGGGDAGQVQ